MAAWGLVVVNRWRVGLQGDRKNAKLPQQLTDSRGAAQLARSGLVIRRHGQWPSALGEVVLRLEQAKRRVLDAKRCEIAEVVSRGRTLLAVPQQLFGSAEAARLGPIALW